MYRWLSVFDILSIPEMKVVVYNEDYWTFYQALHEAGFDINQDIEFEPCYHRRVGGEVVYGPRVIGYERRDDGWMCSGYATEEAWKINIGKRDVSLLRELEGMSRESNFTGELCEHLTNYWGVGSELTRNIEVSEV
jgi:hypothetical protein